MDYRYLGRSALQVSPLCLGAMMFGGATDETDRSASSTRRASRASTSSTPPTATTAGRSEEVVGRAIRDHRAPLGAGDQVRPTMGAGPNAGGQSRKWIFQRRRGQPAQARHRLHRHALLPQGRPQHAAGGDRARPRRPDPRGQGPLFRRVEFQGLADRRDLPHRRPLGMDRPVRASRSTTCVDRTGRGRSSCRPPAITAWASVPYSPLARGVLTGKYGAERHPPDSRVARGDARIEQTEWRPESLDIAQKVADTPRRTA